MVLAVAGMWPGVLEQGGLECERAWWSLVMEKEIPVWAEHRLVGERGVLGAQAGTGGEESRVRQLHSGWGLSLQAIVPHPGIGSEEPCELDFMTNLFVSRLHHP